MLPDRVSNPGPLTYESGARLRYAARLFLCSHLDKKYFYNNFDFSKKCKKLEFHGKNIKNVLNRWHMLTHNILVKFTL